MIDDYVLAADVEAEGQVIQGYQFDTNETYIGKVTRAFHDDRNGSVILSLEDVTVLDEHDEPTDFEKFLKLELSHDSYVKVINNTPPLVNP